MASGSPAITMVNHRASFLSHNRTPTSLKEHLSVMVHQSQCQPHAPAQKLDYIA